MFTGIVEDIGIISCINKENENWSIDIFTSIDMRNIKVGDSVSCDGVCLTIIHKEEGLFKVELSKYTREHISYVNWIKDYKINLELALKVGDLLSGHFVQGHVDAKAKLIDVDDYMYCFEFPEKYKKFIVKKGSIAINGVSLTVFDTCSNRFYVSIVPHTYKNTNLRFIYLGSYVNMEVDIFARYIENFIIKS